ncbi:MAG TPA: DUF1080 domain-containing protein [Opitutales bacterium]|nr:DUF1080 domain-containing protein [Opitutales bacterium]
MKPRTSSLSLVLISLLLTNLSSAESQWIDLFDGESVEAWKAYRGDDFPSDSWIVEEGVLTSQAEAARTDIVTRQQFSDFELELEWRLEPRGNSGIFFRVNEETNSIWHAAPEYQILDDTPETPPIHATGSLYDLLPPNKNKKMRPVGEFNETRIVAKGDKIEHWLNGEKILSYDFNNAELKEGIRSSKFGVHPEFAQSREGSIGLQHHGDSVGFRKIRIREISPSNEK